MWVRIKASCYLMTCTTHIAELTMSRQEDFHVTPPTEQTYVLRDNNHTVQVFLNKCILKYDMHDSNQNIQATW